ncbi:putative ribonuclease H-like domain-containing protein [Tanacetum coccineum]|uniref:Ribonuclease H-like domain-containing protein n=1 Tax=Tanacetum coccineum TaxID=301880 RepID=A0ABQ4ZYA0_9ASTR
MEVIQNGNGPVSITTDTQEGLHKGYDRFQSLLSQLEIHGAGVSTEDVNQKFLRSLPSAWSQVSLITRTKPGVDSLSFDDLYNNLRVFENDVKGSTASSSNTLNDRVTSCSNECKESYAKLKKLYDAQREQLSDASIEIKAYTQGLKKVEAQLVAHQQGQLWQAVPTNVAMKVNTVKPIVNRVRPANLVLLGEKGKLLLSPQQVVIGDNKDITSTKSPITMVDQICDKKNKVLFTDSECLVLSLEFKLPDANQVLLRIPRQNNMYSFNLENIVPSGGKQHKASCKAKSVSSISHSLQLLHMDLFGPTSVRSLNHKTYCLVITDDFSRFSWVFFLRTKDETSGILKDFIRQIENQLNQKVKTIRCDNGTKFKNMDFIEFYGSKGIKREYSNARTPQQNGVAERKNMTLIEAARTMLVDSFLPNTFWAEAVSIACYVLNRVLVTKPHNKIPYELVTGNQDEGFFSLGNSLQSKAFRVYNLETKRVEENLHITFLENKPNIAGKGPTWLFDLDYLTDSMNYQPVRSENQANKHAGPQEANHNAGTEDIIDVGDSKKEAESAQDYFVLPVWSSYSLTVKRLIAKDVVETPNKHPNLKTDEKPEDMEDQVFLDELERLKRQEQDANDAAEVIRTVVLLKKLRICFYKQELLNLALQQILIQSQPHQLVLSVLIDGLFRTLINQSLTRCLRDTST